MKTIRSFLKSKVLIITTILTFGAGLADVLTDANLKGGILFCSGIIFAMSLIISALNENLMKIINDPSPENIEQAKKDLNL